MDARSPIETSRVNVVLSVAFNSTCTHFSVGLNTGYRVYDAKSGEEKVRREFKKGVGQVQMLGNSQILGLVGGGRRPTFPPNKAVIWDDELLKAKREITCRVPVRGIRLSSNEVIVLLKQETRIYSLSQPDTPLGTYPAADNLYGLCSATGGWIAVPGITRGHVQLIGNQGSDVRIIPAHSSPLRAIALSLDGELLATASEQGTLVRVWSTSTSAKVAELRRGADPAAIFSVSFNPSRTLLACTSDKGTLHIYDIPHASARHDTTDRALSGTIGAGNDSEDAASMSESIPDSSKEGKGKWGLLSKIPLLPQYFRDTVSFASAEFSMDEEPRDQGQISAEAVTMDMVRLPKGIIGWIAENTLVVLGGGINARYEKFVISTDSNGERSCVRSGWMKYLEV